MPRKNIVLIPRTVKTLEKMGAQIKRARLRRNIRVEILAEQAGISETTFYAIEKGVSTVSIGAYAAVLAVLEMDNLRFQFGTPNFYFRNECLIPLRTSNSRKVNSLCLMNLGNQNNDRSHKEWDTNT